jgi:hypothetical protein
LVGCAKCEAPIRVERVLIGNNRRTDKRGGKKFYTSMTRSLSKDGVLYSFSNGNCGGGSIWLCNRCSKEFFKEILNNDKDFKPLRDVFEED